MEAIRAKVRYIGQSFGFDGLTNGKIYEAWPDKSGLLHVIDDSCEDYLYSPIDPRPADASCPGGKWEIVEDKKGILTRAFPGLFEET